MFTQEEVNALSLPELMLLEGMIRVSREAQSKSARKKLVASIKEQAKAAGIPFEDIIDSMTAGTKVKLPPKYRNPNDAAETWAGRGMKPKWVSEHLEAGGSMDDIKA